MEHILKPGEEWGGQTSSKFLRTKKHVKEFEHREQPHPLFSTLGKRHIHSQQFRRSEEHQFRSTRVTGIQPKHFMEKHTAKIIEKFTIVKPKSERVGVIDNMSHKLKQKKLLNSKIEQIEEQKAVQALDDWEKNVLNKRKNSKRIN